MRAAVRLVTSFLFAAGCTPTAGAECAAAADCAAPDPAPCDGCPALATSLCAAGACAARGDDAVDVIATINFDRDLYESVAAFVHVVAAADAADGPLACAAAFAGDGMAPGVNVLAAGTKSASGGSLHQNVSFGRAPAGEVAVLVLAKGDVGGSGPTLGTGCVTGLTAAAPSLTVDLVSVE